MSEFKIRTKISYPYPIFSKSDKFRYSNQTNFCHHYPQHLIFGSPSLSAIFEYCIGERASQLFCSNYVINFDSPFWHSNARVTVQVDEKDMHPSFLIRQVSSMKWGKPKKCSLMISVSHSYILVWTRALHLSLIHIWRCRRIERCRSRWWPYH